MLGQGRGEARAATAVEATRPSGYEKAVPRYGFHTFVVASAWPLPDLPLAPPSTEPTVTLALGEPALLAALPVDAYTITVDAEDRHRLLVPEGAVIAIDDRGHAAIATRPTFPQDLLTHLLLGQVLPNALALHQGLGLACLHAATVADEGRAVALLGGQGQGKSTLAAACARAGLALVSDDCTPVRLRAPGSADTRLLVLPGPGRLKLWPDSVAALGIEAAVIGAIHGAEAKCVARWPAAAPAPVPLAGVVLLETGGALALHPVSAEEALAAIAPNCFGHRRTTVAGRARQFAAVAGVALGTRIARLTVPRDLALLPAAVAMVRAFARG